MSIITRLGVKNTREIARISSLTSSFATQSEPPSPVAPDEFRVLKLRPDPVQERQKREIRRTEVPPPRSTQMKFDQDWGSVWPAARSFHPATVPLPVRQGYPLKNAAPPNKYGNAELMKIPNFLHLTPPVVTKQCEALKKFCTPWPAGLETDEKCEKHFPVEVLTSDYCYSSPTIREPLARVVTIRLKLSTLNLDQHARDKLLRLVGDRYNPEDDLLTITSDRCPTRKQNFEYIEYLLTALYHESWRTEPWEAEKSEADMEYYDWDKSKSRDGLITLYCWPEPPMDNDYETIPHATEYKIAVSDLINNGEDEYSLNKYKEAVKNMLFLEGQEKK
ncbi:small ribosomal subunit protein mS35 [Neodiprion pinetum]|uniref:small ribosomal subunit protein mS35 n=1 Tax=Neodiprion pinetum TaxID=441929 RepID=UPI001EDF6997|nr:28S ribosomal protein S35, mitochondrial [Neodiprion pinetum]